MPCEMVDVVDESNEIIDVASRYKVHSKGLWHRCSALYLLRSNGNLVLQRRAFDKEIEPGLLDHSSAGHVSSGESYEESMKRELYEELGIRGDFRSIGSAKQDSVHSNGLKDKQIFNIFLLISDERLVPDQGEVDSLVEISLDRIKEMLSENSDKFTYGFKSTFPVLIHFLGKSGKIL